MPATINGPDTVARLCEGQQPFAFHMARLFMTRHGSAAGLFGGADDVRAEALFAMVRAARHFKPERGYRFTTYAGRIIERHLHERFTALCKKRLPGRVSAAEPVDHRHVPDPLDRADVCEGLRRLKPRERAVIVGAFVEDQSLAAIGRTMHVSRERVRQVHGRALQKLTAYFDG